MENKGALFPDPHIVPAEPPSVTVAELIEKLKAMPQDMEVRFLAGERGDSFAADVPVGDPKIHLGKLNSYAQDFVLLGPEG